MNLEEFAAERFRIQQHLYRTMPEGWENFATRIMVPWFISIAPRKAIEYGTECWEVMGPRALLVDINACYYRYANLSKSEKLKEHQYLALENALIDCFGYCVILSVISQHLPGKEMFHAEDPEDINSQLLNEFWEHGSSWWSKGTTDAFKLAFNMWRVVR